MSGLWLAPLITISYRSLFLRALPAPLKGRSRRDNSDLVLPASILDVPDMVKADRIPPSPRLVMKREEGAELKSTSVPE
jgi:hypothetical protein